MRTYSLLSIIGMIAAVGFALGAVVVRRNADLHAALRDGMQALRTALRGEMQALRTEVRTEIRSLETRLAGVERHQAGVERHQAGIERRQARTEGMLEGLRDAIAGQASGEAQPPRDET